MKISCTCRMTYQLLGMNVNKISYRANISTDNVFLFLDFPVEKR